MKIEEGKFYCTRNGRLVGPMLSEIYPETLYWKGWLDGRYRFWFRDGKVSAGDWESAFDLVAEYGGIAMQSGPVREITSVKKEIVPGEYAGVQVINNGVFSYGAAKLSIPRVMIGIKLGTEFTAQGLREASAVLIALAEALDHK